MRPRSNEFEKTDERRGFTLTEVLVAVALVFALSGIVLVSSRAVRNSRRITAVEQELALIAQAIDQYASFWPKWKVGGVVVADKGWPDFIPGRLFDTNFFEEQSAHHFNDDLAFNPIHLDKDVKEAITDLRGDGNDPFNANLCLAYCLTEHSGKGPYIMPDDNLLLRDIDDDELVRQFRSFGITVTDPLYPASLSTGSARRGQVLVDPWGTPYRYFWVYRDSSAYNGYLPVETADIYDANFHTAVSFVVESAGPDKKFGNVWQLDSYVDEVWETEEASDNYTLKP